MTTALQVAPVLAYSEQYPEYAIYTGARQQVWWEVISDGVKTGREIADIVTMATADKVVPLAIDVWQLNAEGTRWHIDFICYWKPGVVAPTLVWWIWLLIGAVGSGLLSNITGGGGKGGTSIVDIMMMMMMMFMMMSFMRK